MRTAHKVAWGGAVATGLFTALYVWRMRQADACARIEKLPNQFPGALPDSSDTTFLPCANARVRAVGASTLAVSAGLFTLGTVAYSVMT